MCAARQELQQPVLGVVRVLVLVHEDVAERLLPALARLGEAVEHVDRAEEEVVEVHRVRVEEAALVEAVDLGDGLVVERRDARAILLVRDERVLGARDLRVDAARGEPLRIPLQLLEALLHHAHLVGLVVDREARLVAEPRRLAAEDAAAGGVEGEDPDPARGVAQQPLEALAHLAGGLVRERDRQDLVRLDPERGDQVGDAVRKHAGLPGAGAGHHEQRPFRGQDGLALGRVEVGEIGLGRRDGHRARL